MQLDPDWAPKERPLNALTYVGLHDALEWGAPSEPVRKARRTVRALPPLPEGPRALPPPPTESKPLLALPWEGPEENGNGRQDDEEDDGDSSSNAATEKSSSAKISSSSTSSSSSRSDPNADSSLKRKSAPSEQVKVKRRMLSNVPQDPPQTPKIHPKNAPRANHEGPEKPQEEGNKSLKR